MPRGRGGEGSSSEICGRGSRASEDCQVRSGSSLPCGIWFHLASYGVTAEGASQVRRRYTISLYCIQHLGTLDILGFALPVDMLLLQWRLSGGFASTTPLFPLVKKKMLDTTPRHSHNSSLHLKRPRHPPRLRPTRRRRTHHRALVPHRSLVPREPPRPVQQHHRVPRAAPDPQRLLRPHQPHPRRCRRRRSDGGRRSGRRPRGIVRVAVLQPGRGGGGVGICRGRRGGRGRGRGGGGRGGGALLAPRRGGGGGDVAGVARPARRRHYRRR